MSNDRQTEQEFLMLNSASFLLKGAAMGIANIIPGVSGGTMALILGIYQRLLAALKGGQKGWRALDLAFVIPLGIGLILSVLLASRLITVLLRDYHNPTYGLFFGFVAVSIIAPLKLIGRKTENNDIGALGGVKRSHKLTTGVALLFGALLVFGIAQLGERSRIARYVDADLSGQKTSDEYQDSQMSTHPAMALTGVQAGLSFFLAGFVAIAAMLLPGLSGSLVLLLTGMYFSVLRAINNHNLFLIGIFCLGCGLGLLLSARAISWLLERHFSTTMAFLAGLMLGSLYQLWPFKTFAMVEGERVDIANFMPSLSSIPSDMGRVLLQTIAAAGIGAICVWVMMYVESRHSSA